MLMVHVTHEKACSHTAQAPRSFAFTCLDVGFTPLSPLSNLAPTSLEEPSRPFLSQYGSPLAQA